MDKIPSTIELNPASSLEGDIQVPGDKSITHRAIMFGAIADGQTEINGALMGADCVATMGAMQQLGVSIEQSSDSTLSIHGVGMQGLKASDKPLDLGNAGTGIRLLTGLLAGANIPAVLTGDHSLCSRPMLRIVNPLRQMGASINLQADDTAPIEINPHRQLKAIDYAMPVASAQVKSAVLLAGLYAQGCTSVLEPAITRDHTERMLQTFGVSIERTGQRIRLCEQPILKGTSITVPGDISSAAFFMVGASIAEKADVMIRQVGINPTRTGVIDILRLMGADISLLNERQLGGEPVADIHIKPAALKGIKIPSNLVPLAIDELPVVMIAAACAEGQTMLQDAAELKVKESNRIQAMVDGLVALGIDAEATDDGMIVQGGTFHGGTVDSLGDHRIAMAFAMASLRATQPITILHCDNIATSFPNFMTLSQGLGLTMNIGSQT